MRELGQLCLWAGIFAAIPERLGEMMAAVMREPQLRVAVRGLPFVRVFVWPAGDRSFIVVSARPRLGQPRSALEIPVDVAAIYSDMLLEGRRAA
jgi:hypothetical protein